MLFAQPKKGTAGFLVTPHVDPKTNIPSYKLTYANVERIAGKAVRASRMSPSRISKASADVRVIVVGGSASKVGKTTLACALVRREPGLCVAMK